jgi:DNA-binding HxlR family transcriptional regulator
MWAHRGVTLRGGAHVIQGTRVGDRVGQGRGRPSDQAAQIIGAGEQLAAAQAEVGVGEDFHGACRFSELRKRLSGVSEKMLTQTLRAVERDGLVLRTVYPAVPVRVEYALTPLGQTLREPLKTLTEWSVRHVAEVIAAREEYDAHAERVS